MAPCCGGLGSIDERRSDKRVSIVLVMVREVDYHLIETECSRHIGIP